MISLRHRGNTPRTSYNQLIFLRTFFRAHGLSLPVQKGNWPSYTDRVVRCYQPDELQALLNAADPDEREMIQFFLYTGRPEAGGAVCCLVEDRLDEKDADHHGEARSGLPPGGPGSGNRTAAGFPCQYVARAAASSPTHPPDL